MFGDGGLADGMHAVPDAAAVVGVVAFIDVFVEFTQPVDFGNGRQVVAPEAADVAFDAALLMGPVMPGWQ